MGPSRNQPHSPPFQGGVAALINKKVPFLSSADGVVSPARRAIFRSQTQAARVHFFRNPRKSTLQLCRLKKSINRL